MIPPASFLSPSVLPLATDAKILVFVRRLVILFCRLVILFLGVVSVRPYDEHVFALRMNTNKFLERNDESADRSDEFREKNVIFRIILLPAFVKTKICGTNALGSFRRQVGVFLQFLLVFVLVEEATRNYS